MIIAFGFSCLCLMSKFANNYFRWFRMPAVVTSQSVLPNTSMHVKYSQLIHYMYDMKEREST
jgi:hypothetical protein